jgi:putative oxidoreductase
MLQGIFGVTASLAFVILRVAVGVIFVAHGYQKIQGGVGRFGGFLSSLGVPFPAVFAYVVSYTEFLGGIALILGLATPLAALMIAATMVVAIVKVKLNKGLIGGYEFDLALLAAVIALALTGPGVLSLDHLIGLV